MNLSRQLLFPTTVILALVVNLGLPSTGFAQAPPPSLPPQTISLAEARAVIEGAIAMAREKNARLGVVVLDAASAEMVAGEHMDGAPGRNIMFAQGK